MAVLLPTGIHDALELMHKELSANSQGMGTKSQKIHNANKNFVPFNSRIGDYVIMHPANAQHRELNTGWIGPVRIVEAKSDLLFVVEDLHKSKYFTVHAQRLIPYPI